MECVQASARDGLKKSSSSVIAYLPKLKSKLKKIKRRNEDAGSSDDMHRTSEDTSPRKYKGSVAGDFVKKTSFANEAIKSDLKETAKLPNRASMITKSPSRSYKRSSVVGASAKNTEFGNLITQIKEVLTLYLSSHASQQDKHSHVLQICKNNPICHHLKPYLTTPPLNIDTLGVFLFDNHPDMVQNAPLFITDLGEYLTDSKQQQINHLITQAEAYSSITETSKYLFDNAVIQKSFVTPRILSNKRISSLREASKQDFLQQFQNSIMKRRILPELEMLDKNPEMKLNLISECQKSRARLAESMVVHLKDSKSVSRNQFNSSHLSEGLRKMLTRSKAQPLLVLDTTQNYIPYNPDVDIPLYCNLDLKPNSSSY